MRRGFVRRIGIALALLALPAASAAADAGPPAGRGSYPDLVALFDEFNAWKDLAPPVGELNTGDVRGNVDDYSTATVAARRTAMDGFDRRLADLNVAAWSRGQQVDYLAVRAKFDEQRFILTVSRPWARDPGFYADRMLEVAFTELPAAGPALATLRRELRAVPVVAADASANLTAVAGDYADLALHNLSNADGVGHGHPYRAVPPAGIVGWYDDLLARARTAQPELVPEIVAARDAVLGFKAWLTAERPRMTAPAGVGEANFDWYLKHAKLLPYTSAQLLVLGERETERLWAARALEQHRNRRLAPLTPALTAADYERRKTETGTRIRDFLAREEIITVPADTGPLPINVPFITRPGGRNFWEEVQFRDPTPDYLHATIPGHYFDGAMAKRVANPLRRRIADGVRVEGWGVYLEETAVKLGFLDDRPQVRELIDVFGIFRAVRVAGDIRLQLNRASVAEVVADWRRWTPWLDADVARVDAEIYLRRPPGYGIGYTIGMIEMQKLLADRKHQLGDKFVLRAFHDEFMAAGRLPLSLVRWDMTGNDDEVRQFWRRDPLPQPMPAG